MNTARIYGTIVAGPEKNGKVVKMTLEYPRDDRGGYVKEPGHNHLLVVALSNKSKESALSFQRGETVCCEIEVRSKKNKSATGKTYVNTEAILSSISPFSLAGRPKDPTAPQPPAPESTPGPTAPSERKQTGMLI